MWHIKLTSYNLTHETWVREFEKALDEKKFASKEEKMSKQ
jgi:hypothetical protein